jgi:hypothetical protein
MTNPEAKDEKGKKIQYSVGGKFSVNSSTTGETLSGVTMENNRAGKARDREPIPAGTYQAFLRDEVVEIDEVDKTKKKIIKPKRIQLENVLGYGPIQIHAGGKVGFYEGCIGVGTSYDNKNHTLQGSWETLKKVVKIVENDTKIAKKSIPNIRVIVDPLSVRRQPEQAE